MPVLSPVLNDDNSVGYSLGIQFKLRQVFSDGSKADVKLIKVEEENVFYGLFDVEDTDFELYIDNKSGQGNFWVDLKVPNKDMKKLMIVRGLWHTLKALEVNGRHFHFVSQEIVKGKTIVAMNADLNEVSFEEEALYCSRIEFSLRVEEEVTDESNGSPFPLMGGRVARCARANPKVGPRGVVCVGEPTDQRYFKIRYRFKESKEYELKPFTFELRMKSD